MGGIRGYKSCTVINQTFHQKQTIQDLCLLVGPVHTIALFMTNINHWNKPYLLNKRFIDV